MRKIVNGILALVIVLSLVCTVYVSADTFAASVTAKPAPVVIATGGTADKPMVEIVDGDDQNLHSFDIASVVVTSVAEKDEDYVEAEVQSILTEVYEQLSAPEVKLSEVMPKLTEVVEKVAAEDTAMKDMDVDTLVVKDLFNVSVSEELKTVLQEEGKFLKLTFEPKLAQNQLLIVMVCVDGEWISVDYVLNEDGTITCMFDKVGTVAFLVNTDMTVDAAETLG